MTPTHADTLEATVRDARGLVPWAEPNADALAWEPLEQAVLRALAGPVPAHMEGVPLLRFADGREAITLVEAVMDPPVPRAGRAWLTCDISPWLRDDLAHLTGAHQMREPNTLWVPCGASVVQVTMRNYAASRLQDEVGTALVWC